MKTYGLSTHCDLWLGYTVPYSANADPPTLYVNNTHILVFFFIGVVLINIHSILLLAFLLLGSYRLILIRPSWYLTSYLTLNQHQLHVIDAN